MADRILGPAYPALLAPGLRVYVDGDDNAGTVLRVEPDNDVRVAWDDWLDRPNYGPGFGRECAAELLIDYADPHTRDRVDRAIVEDGRMPSPGRNGRVALRAVATAVWGPR